MSKRILLVVLLSSMIVAVVANRPVTSETKPQEAAAPDLPQLLDFEVAELALPGLQVEARAFDVAVPVGGLPYTLNLVPHSVRAPDFRLLVDPGNRQLQEVEVPAPSTYRGTVAGMPGARVAATLSEGKLWAQITFAQDDVWYVEPLSDLTGQPAAEALHVSYRDQDVVPMDNFCGVVIPPRPKLAVPPDEPLDGGIAGTGIVIADVACDADVEYWVKNNSNVITTMIDIENVINQMEEIYEDQTSITYELTTIIVRTGAVTDDPYSSSICGTLLDQLRDVWNSAPESAIKRDTVQLFTGRVLSDCLGIAYLATVCEPVATGFAYSLVESKATGLPFSFRLGLTAHELAHNWNAVHCCGGCAGCGGCRIMCPCIGGCSGIVTSFEQSAVDAINAYKNANSACFVDLPEVITPPFFDDVPASLLAADKWIWSKGALSSNAALGEPSPAFSIHLDAAAGGTYQDDELRSNFIDLSGMGGAGVLVSYWTEHSGVEDGEELVVEYWAGLQWTELNRVTSDGVDQTEFELHQHSLTGLNPSPFHSEFRLRFRSEVNEANDEWYIDDVFVGILPPPSNNACASPAPISDGTTPFSTVGATTDGLPLVCEGGSPSFERDIWFTYVAPCAGPVTISTCNDADFDTLIAVYFPGACPPSSPVTCSDDAPACGTTSEVEFEAFKALPYVIRVGGKNGAAGTGNITIACGAGPACAWDCDGSADGNVNINDLLALLGQYDATAPVNCVGGSCDYDGSGCVDVVDLLKLLAHYTTDPLGIGCP